MKPYLECLELRLALNAAPLTHPAVDIVDFGGNANDWVPLTQVMVSGYASLLAPYGVGQGSIAAVVSLPDPGTVSPTQVNAAILNLMATGQLPAPGPNTLVMIYLNDKPTGRPANEAAFHDVLTFNGQPFRDTWVWTQSNESVPDTHEFAEATSGQEIADAVDGQAFQLGGFWVSNFALPGGQPYHSPQWPGVIIQPAQQSTAPQSSPLGNLFALAVERIEANLFSLLARVNPAFDPRANAAAQAVTANPLHGTAQGQWVEMQVDAVFVAWVQLPR